MSIDTSAGGGLWRGIAAHEALDRLVQHAQVQVEPDGVDVTRLLGAKQVSRPAHFHVLEGDLVACAELGVVLEHLETTLGVRVDVRRARAGSSTRGGASDRRGRETGRAARAQGVGTIRRTSCSRSGRRAALDDERGDEHVDLAVHELVHDVLELPLPHLAVRNGDARARRDAAECRRGDDGLDAVVDEEHLSATIELARDALLEQAIVDRLDEVSTGERSRGGVCISVMSRRPASERCSVRGIGVAVSVRTSVSSLSCLRRSLCFTPNRCSSSTMMRPRSSKTTSGLRRRCVPMTISTFSRRGRRGWAPAPSGTESG